MNGTAASIPFPPVVYVPCSAVGAGDETVSVDLRPTRDGRTALLVYSALDRLVDCCGDRQPWVVMPTASLDTVQEATRFELLLLDVDIPQEFRRHDAQP